MFKKIIFGFFACSVALFGLTAGMRPAQAVCLVANEKDGASEPYNLGSLRRKIQTYNNADSAEGFCDIPSGTADDSSFDQAINFFTEEWDLIPDGVLNYTNTVEDPIVLVDTLKFNNKDKMTVVVGNWGEGTTPISSWTDYGNVTIDGTALAEGEAVFACGSSQPDDSVTLRNLTIKMNAPTAEDGSAITDYDLFGDNDGDGEDDLPCLVDGGDNTVEVSGGTTPTTDYDSDEDGDGYYVDGDDEGDECGDTVSSARRAKRSSSSPVGFKSYVLSPIASIVADRKYTLSAVMVDSCDCDDSDESIHPDAEEICGDGIDQDCDDEDEECGEGGEEDTDDDGDGYSEDGTVGGAEDCDDTAEDTDGDGVADGYPINPAAEDCDEDEVDENCDGSYDMLSSCDEAADDDGDGYCEAIYECPDESLGAGDCDDDDPDINPGVTEIEDDGTCSDEIDNNCDGGTDTDATCPDYSATDDDGDGYSEDGTVGGAEDCDDEDATINPGASEYDAGDDDIDNDCDGETDEVFAGESTDDDDGDGYCEDTEACTDDTVLPGDCNDASAEASPVGVEACDDEEDNDCDGETDEGCVGDADVDDDGDGYSEDGSVGGELDCDDGDAAVNVDADESSDTEGTCDDSADNDCDGDADALDDGCVSGDVSDDTGSSGCGCDVSATNGSANYLELILGLLGLVSMRIVTKKKSVGA
ncbi:MAG: hypothetical protein HYU99_06985 [Deltaproteobacteria bacterium]|nr:hypothetical protein [Deltaproteobacteria bacterium]